MRDEVMQIFVDAMESDKLTDKEKLEIIDDLYEVMDIFNSAYGG